jgi:hypothetical protein
MLSCYCYHCAQGYYEAIISRMIAEEAQLHAEEKQFTPQELKQVLFSFSTSVVCTKCYLDGEYRRCAVLSHFLI